MDATGSGAAGRARTMRHRGIGVVLTLGLGVVGAAPAQGQNPSVVHQSSGLPANQDTFTRPQRSLGGGRLGGGPGNAIDAASLVVGAGILARKVYRHFFRKRQLDRDDSPRGKLLRSLEACKDDLAQVERRLYPALADHYQFSSPDHYGRLVQDDPHLDLEVREEILTFLADDRFARGDLDGAETCFNSVIDINYENAVALDGLAEIQRIRGGRLAGTGGAAAAPAPLAPGPVAGRRLVAGASPAGGPPDRRPPDRTSPVASTALARSLLERGQPGDAIRVLERLVRQSPAQGDLWSLLGDAYRQSGRLDQAQGAYARAMSLYGGPR